MLENFIRKHIDQEIVEAELAELFQQAYLVGLITGETESLIYEWIRTNEQAIH